MCECAEVHACHKMPLIMLAINFYSLDATVGIQWTVADSVFILVGPGGLDWRLEMVGQGVIKRILEKILIDGGILLEIYLS